MRIKICARKGIVCFMIILSLVLGTSCAPSTSDSVAAEVLRKQLPNMLFIDSLPEKTSETDLYSTSHMYKIKSLLCINYMHPNMIYNSQYDIGLFEILLLYDSGLPLAEGEWEAINKYLNSLNHFQGIFYHDTEDENEEFYTDLLISTMLYEFSDQYGLEITPPAEFREYIVKELDDISFSDSRMKFLGLLYSANYLQIEYDEKMINAYIDNWLSIGENHVINHYDDAINFNYLALCAERCGLSYSLSLELKAQIMSEISFSYTDIASLYLYIQILNGFRSLTDEDEETLKSYVSRLDKEYQLSNGQYSEIMNLTYSLQATSCAIYIFQTLDENLPNKDVIREYVVEWNDSSLFLNYSTEDLYYFYTLCQQLDVDVSEKFRAFLTEKAKYIKLDYFNNFEPRELFCFTELFRQLGITYPVALKTAVENKLSAIKSGDNECDTPASISLLIVMSKKSYLNITLDKNSYISIFESFDFSKASVVDLLYYPQVASILGMEYDQKMVADALARLKRMNGYIISPDTEIVTLFSTAMGLELSEKLTKSND